METGELESEREGEEMFDHITPPDPADPITLLTKNIIICWSGGISLHWALNNGYCGPHFITA